MIAKIQKYLCDHLFLYIQMRKLRTKEMRKSMLGFKIINNSIEIPFYDSKCGNLANMPPRTSGISALLPSSHNLPPQLPVSFSSLENYLQFLEYTSYFIPVVPSNMLFLLGHRIKQEVEVCSMGRGWITQLLRSLMIQINFSVDFIAISKYCLLFI